MAANGRYAIGWICAVATEFVAARLVLDAEHGQPQYLAPCDTNQYCLGSIGDHNVVITVLPEARYRHGTSAAATVVTNMLNSFPNVRIGLAVGLGVGASNETKDIRLGDIVVSTSRADENGDLHYDCGKFLQNKPFERARMLHRSPTVLRTAIAGLRADHEINGHLIEEVIEDTLTKYSNLRRKYGRPSEESESHHIRPDHCTEGCALPTGDGFLTSPDRDEDDRIMIHYGTINSSNRLMRDAKTRDRVSTEENILCFEKEAALLMDLLPCVAIRGICGYSNSPPNQDWQRYAALVAAAYAKELLLVMVPRSVEGEDRAQRH
ncbi:nucleoside phosphorylase domain-containing protein [Emericellopsis atlantica]|uniref:Nucleoside phosphorylase domain-containing protein n=1 Tax=Emericellopsis atlantica TaxID=2614577 RepID=A0A9P7ZM79_9HYPO|nr:nucleoside phosphorylase domain-containing protein [Emericellopsis atlantica]KAG9254073.1 nucleoside phosphorylase domain-containing protein [Emericellopsis atlantica]